MSLKQVEKKTIFTLGGVSLAWLILAEALCPILVKNPEQTFLVSKWIIAIWGLCILDLAVLTKGVSALFQFVSSDPASQKRIAYSIQVFYWGFFKLICLGLFILILLKGQKIPICGLLLGMGTLGVVPLVGGFFWSQRVLRNA